MVRQDIEGKLNLGRCRSSHILSYNPGNGCGENDRQLLRIGYGG